MTSETAYRIAFFSLLFALLIMRVYFVVKERQAGGRLLPEEQAVSREGGRVVLILRIVFFIALMAILGIYLVGAAWIAAFSIPLPAWLRWAGFMLGIFSVILTNIILTWNARAGSYRGNKGAILCLRKFLIPWRECRKPYL